MFDYHDGQLTNEVSVAPNGGYGFGPRHLDFHPTKPWVYVALERQNRLDVFEFDDGGAVARADPPRRHARPSPNNIRGRQVVGTVHVHPNGRTVYVANRASSTTEANGERVFVGGENSLAVFGIDPNTGAPTPIQHVDTRGIHCRTFHIDPSGRLLVAAHIMGLPVREMAARVRPGLPVAVPHRGRRPARFRPQIRCRCRRPDRCAGWAWWRYKSARIAKRSRARRARIGPASRDAAREARRIVDTVENDVFETAKRVLPGGTFGNFPGEVIIREGKGGRVWDENGKEYVDYLLGSGPMLVGHAHPEVTEAAQAQIDKGTTFFANNRLGIELAEAIVDAVPCAEQVRFVSSGTEADLYAMRAARAYHPPRQDPQIRGRLSRDERLFADEPGAEALRQFPAAGAGFGRHPEKRARRHDHRAVQRRRGRVGAWCASTRTTSPASSSSRSSASSRPRPAFLPALRQITQENGVPLIFDEVVTGFRLAYGGAQEYYGVVPDLCTLGKVIGGGFPLAAIAGKAEIMAHFDKNKVGDENYLVQIGTLSGNPVAAAAGLATMAILKRPGAYERIHGTGRELMAALGGLLKRGRHPGADQRRAAAVRCRVHRPADTRLSRHAFAATPS